MHIAVHQYLIIKIIPLSHRLCTRLCTLIHTTGSLLIIRRENNWKKSIHRRMLESLFRVISKLQITVVKHTPLQTEYVGSSFADSQIQECWHHGSSLQKSCTPTFWILYIHMESASGGAKGRPGGPWPPIWGLAPLWPPIWVSQTWSKMLSMDN